MSKTIKNLLIFFTILCAFVFIIFSIELLVINRGDGDNGEPQAPPPSENSPAGNLKPPGQQTNGGGQAENPDTSGNPDGSEDTNNPDGSETEPEGTRYSFAMPGDMDLILYVNDEWFEYTEPESEEGICTFKYMGTAPAALELRFVLLPQGADADEHEFLNEIIGSDNYTVGDEEPIRGSELTGVAVSGEKDGMAYEVWIHSFSSAGIDNAGVAFIISYQDSTPQNNIPKNALYYTLDTIKMIES